MYLGFPAFSNRWMSCRCLTVLQRFKKDDISKSDLVTPDNVYIICEYANVIGLFIIEDTKDRYTRNNKAPI